MHLPGFRPSLCLSVCLSVRPILPPHTAAAGLLLWARQEGDTDRLFHGGRAAGECGQCHVVSVRVAEHRLVYFVR